MAGKRAFVTIILGLFLSAGFVYGETPNQIMGKDGAPMLLIPAGEFQMGSENGRDDEKPVHTVYVDAFYMDKYEVTNAQYAKFLNEYGNHFDPAGHIFLDPGDKGDPPGWFPTNGLIDKVGAIYQPKAGYEDHPVIAVSWYGAVEYAKFYGKRLPTEAEWEKAARGRFVGREYPWGDAITHDDANYRDVGGRDKWKNTAPVGSFAPNGYGLYDMAGNAWEWCADWYGSYSGSRQKNPTGPRSGAARVLRGGAWCLTHDALRCADRYGNGPTETFYGIGFRCAKDVKPEPETDRIEGVHFPDPKQ